MGLITARFCFSECAAGTCRSMRSAPTCTSDSRYLAVLVGLDDVALLEVLVVREAHGALESLSDLAGVVLEALERGDGAVPDDGALTDVADLGAPGDHAVAHHTPGNLAHSWDLEDLEHLGVAGDDLLVLGLEHAHHGGLDLLEDLVDDLVGADLDALGLGQLAALAIGPHVEADDGGVGGGGQL